MLWYIIKLALLLPLIGGLIYGSLKLTQRMQARLGADPGMARRIRLVETLMLSPTQKLAVIEFRGREILISTSRAGVVALAETPTANADVTGAQQ